ncbi:MAG: hypothetical protein CMJ75_20895 [Planctomycetaceae bacterium]|nr:hypothetical protein [Planctomycetaceae bacterium]
MAGEQIQLGVVRRLPPTPQTPPDRRTECSVVRCGDTGGPGLPVFLSWDGLRRLCEHVCSDAEVELGGVLVGDQCQDEQGNPFVIMTGSLAAQDYTNSAGSFTFTHNTWSRFTRELESLSGNRRIIGWYHSHPGWGVFLSDRDQFICENFFAGALDIAVVVDPQSNQLGVFQRICCGKSDWLQPAAGCCVFVEGVASAEMTARGLPTPLRYFVGPVGANFAAPSRSGRQD